MGIYHATILAILLLLLSDLGIPVSLVRAQTRETAEIGEEAINFTREDEQTVEVRKIDFTITAEGKQTFDELMWQAGLLAQGFIEQGLAESPSVTEVVVSILCKRHGQTVPLLMVRVSRFDWQAQPSVDQWARYFAQPAKVLLGFAAPQIQQPFIAPSSSSSSERSLRGRSRGSRRRRVTSSSQSSPLVVSVVRSQAARSSLKAKSLTRFRS